jgi:hypothetical protein
VLLQLNSRLHTGLVIVEQAESFDDLFHRISFRHLGGHHLQELIEINGAGAVGVDVGNHLLDFLLLGLETESAHGHLQLLGIDGAGAVGIEEVESLADLLLLLLGKGELVTLLLLLAAGGGTTVVGLHVKKSVYAKLGIK